MYFRQPNLLLLRTMLIQHLKHNTDIVLHTEFSNCLSAEWQIFLKKSYPYFMIISDIGVSYPHTDYLKIFLSHSLSKKINVVLPSGDNSDALRVFAYHIKSKYEHREFFEQVCQTILLLKDLQPEGSDIRCAVCVLTCATVLKIYKSMIGKAKSTETLKEPFNEEDKIEALTLEEVADLCRMQCLSVAFLCHLPLSQRAQMRILHSCWTTQALPFITMTFRKIFFQLRRETNFFKLLYLAKKGIGYHHSAMKAKERQSVEMLFRMGYIQVVTATSTLALGINMPCKSVVFVEDSVYLDALNYRQMCGRAGRRGQDLLGNVFFYDIPLPKIEKLMKSNVPELKGQFPLSITLILRLMLLAAKAEDKADAKAKVLSVLSHSLLSFKQQKNEEMLKIYFIFSLQFLLREGYLDQDGNPMGYTGLVTHLHYHAPSNFVLVDFLTKGLLHKLCQPSEKGHQQFSSDMMEKLVLVLSHLFGRRYLPPCLMELKNTFCQSKVFLDDLPEEFADAVKAYNSKIENIFGCFLLNAAKLADMEQEYHLPLSKTGDPDIVSHSLTSNVRKSNFFNIQTNILLLSSSVVANSEVQSPLIFNKGDTYNIIQDFSLTIKAIGTSLDELCENKDDNVVLAFKQLAESYKAKLDKV
ncbi:probable ATP-dependent RNA helicase DDX60 [Rhineura floridana]|uniref:probable ATP-dependent RNA helicase DDX60 n=1 Tax=Rhineura floridana TaxID=261503 RepID=UPI002AC81444|nr:probable ATP-dependent RNA helicase DDX60 [Rhineura floridana]